MTTDLNRITSNIEKIASRKKYFILGISYDELADNKISVTGFAEGVTLDEMMEGFKLFILESIERKKLEMESKR